MRYKDNIILENDPIIIGGGFNMGEYTIRCPKCNKISKYNYDIQANQMPKYCTYCKADFEDKRKRKNTKIELTNFQTRVK